MQLTLAAVHDFQAHLLDYYAKHGRYDLPWRLPGPDGSFDPYRVLVSEIMLQQTQVSRVIPKFHEFLKQFPAATILAEAPLGQVITAWSGLGYNRRAKYLQQAAQYIVEEYEGRIPNDDTKLVKLPGVGKNTAGAIRAYAFNGPAVFVETNIRTVYIHHFFGNKTGIPDKAITELIEQTLDREEPRRFYWALMDYGSHLKSTIGNLNKLSKSYVPQSSFVGSRRQIRGQVLKALAAGPLAPEDFAINDARLPAVLQELSREGLIHFRDGQYRL